LAIDIPPNTIDVARPILSRGAICVANAATIAQKKPWTTAPNIRATSKDGNVWDSIAATFDAARTSIRIVSSGLRGK
jgi:hypothetical protein